MTFSQKTHSWRCPRLRCCLAVGQAKCATSKARSPPGPCSSRIVHFIERNQSDLIKRILRHGGLWEGPLRTLATARAPPGPYPTSAEPGELQLILDGDFLDTQRAATERFDAPHGETGELQLILDPESSSPKF